MTERLHFHFSLSCIGKGNGNPLQCSCLANPRDRGAWWEAVYGVTQSRTQLKRLSSSRWVLVAVVGLSSCGEPGILFFAAFRLLIALTSRFRAQDLAHQASTVVEPSFVALCKVESSRTRDRSHVSCTGGLDRKSTRLNSSHQR